jgi:tetratricopeptide (TPR) repeat protein
MTEDLRIQEAMDAVRMGDLLVEQGRLDAALAVYQTGLDLNRALAAEHPENATYWREQSVCHDRIGDTLMRLDRAEEALTAYETSIKLSTLLLRIDTADIGFGEDLAIGYNNAGNALARLGRSGEAHRQFQLGVAMRARLVETNPENATLRRQLMVNLIKLAETSDNAAQCYRRAQEQAVWLAAAGKLGPNEAIIPDMLGRKALEMETAAPGDGRSNP